MAIDNKLRGFDLVKMKVVDVMASSEAKCALLSCNAKP
jgi:hypothetical protein